MDGLRKYFIDRGTPDRINDYSINSLEITGSCLSRKYATDTDDIDRLIYNAFIASADVVISNMNNNQPFTVRLVSYDFSDNWVIEGDPFKTLLSG